MEGNQKENTLGEWSDGDDDWVNEIAENTLGEWSDSDDDEIIRNVDEKALGLLSSDDGEIIRNVDENTLREQSDDDEDENVQTGCGKKRKSTEMDGGSSTSAHEENFYVLENVRNVKSKKFQMDATNYTVRFNNAVSDLDLVESYERTQEIFEHLLRDVTTGMNEKDQVRFVLRSTQLDTPISLPFMPLWQLTAERIFSQIERVIQSNQDFRLNDTVTVNMIRVVTPQGSGRKRTVLDISEYLHKKGSIIVIRNNDDLCLARALVVIIAKIEKDPKYKSLVDPRGRVQERKARELHQVAGVPLGPCGIPEVEMFQKHLTDYEINIVSADHNNCIIYPPKPTTTNVKSIYLYLHGGHYDVITSMPGFLGKSYFCHKCKQAYDNTLGHLCEGMCTSCRSFGCIVNDPVKCDRCNRWFNSQTCYDRHKEPIGRGKSVCDGVRKCGKCGKSVEIRKLNPKNHLCGRKCRTCGVVLNEKDEHKCYIQKPKKKSKKKSEQDPEEHEYNELVSDQASEHSEESQYNELLFFDFECTQEGGIHKPNLCIVHDEAGHEKIFQGKNTTVDFCKWLFTEEHRDCIVLAHNFQGYDGYFIQKYLNENCVMYEIVLTGAKILSMTIPMFNIKFVDSLNFIPMPLAKFPKTFGMTELCKGYFPHNFNKEENQNYVGPIPDADYYTPNTMKPKDREAFLAWHKEQRDNGYIFNFREEIVRYCRSDVDILRKCCMEFREMLRDITGIDPFEECLTIASTCHLVYRTNFLEKDTIAVFQPARQLKMKQSNLAVKWLSYLMQENDIRIEHVRNGGEKRVGKYSLDGYCEEFHTAYEFQGCFWHGEFVKKLLGFLNRCVLIYGSFHRLYQLLCQRNGKSCKWENHATTS